jgi:hypothetical protein
MHDDLLSDTKMPAGPKPCGHKKTGHSFEMAGRGIALLGNSLVKWR